MMVLSDPTPHCAYKHMDTTPILRRKCSHSKLPRSLFGISIFVFSTGLEREPIYFPGDEDSVSQEFMPTRTVLPRCYSHKLGGTGCKSKGWRLSSFQR